MDLLFDLYGTLIDINTDEDSDYFWKKLSRKTKRYKAYQIEDLKKEYYEQCKNLSLEVEEVNILKVFENIFGVSNASRCARLFRKYSTNYIKLYKGVKPFLKRLRSEGYSIYLLSNAQNAFTVYEMKKLGIYKLFNGIGISSDYGVKKPNLSFYNKVINYFKLNNPIMIGNEYECDIAPAKKLGLRTIYIESNLTYKKVNEDKIEGPNYDLVYKRIKELNF